MERQEFGLTLGAARGLPFRSALDRRTRLGVDASPKHGAGTIEAPVRELFPGGVDRVLELVGTVTLRDSLKCARAQGIVCVTGILGNEWTIRDFDPMAMIPPSVRLTVYTGEAENMDVDALQEFLDDVASGDATVNVNRVFRLEEVADAHRYMEENRATGKLVVVG